MAIVNPNNVIQGPADLYYGIVGAVEPLDSAVATAPSNTVWTDFGATSGGATFDVEETLSQIQADQSIDPLGARVTARAITVTATLIEATPQNIYQLLNQAGTLTVNVGNTTFDPANNTAATQPTYTALIVDGWAPTLTSGAIARRRLIVRRCLATPKLTQNYREDGTIQLAATWTGYYVSKTVAPFHMVDQTA